MKKIFFTLIAIVGFTTFATVQIHYKMDGTPDMRYKENRAVYGNTYSTPSYPTTPSYPSRSYSTPSYPRYESNRTYTNPYTGSQSSYPSYPTTKSGAPDMRYKENRNIYGY